MSSPLYSTVTRSAELPGVEIWQQHVVAPGIRFMTPAYLIVGARRGMTERAWVEVQHGSRDYRSTGPNFCLMPPGEFLKIRGASAGLQTDGLLITEEFLSGMLEERFVAPKPTAFVGEELRPRFEDALYAIEDPHADALEREVRVRGYLSAVLSRAAGSEDETRSFRSRALVRRVRELIEDRFADAISLDEIGRAVGASKFLLERSFAKEFGLPIHAYRKLVRIRRAMELLRAGARPIEVAARVGFFDQAHMNRAFRRELGITPRSYQDGVTSKRRSRRGPAG